MSDSDPSNEKHLADQEVEVSSQDVEPPKRYKVKWYRSTYYNAIILGLCNFCAPGIWGAMNSLGGGGEESPWLVDAANALTFCLMVLTCALSGIFVKYLGIRWTLILGAAGYAPFAAGLYCNNRFQTQWGVLFGAACCGLGAGIFWMAEAAIALTYPEPYNQGRFLGLWLMFRIGGQVLGGAVNLGLNVNRDQAGSVSYGVYLVFIAIQSAGPFIGLLLTAPAKVQRTDGITVSCAIPKEQKVLAELKATGQLFLTKRYLLIVPFIAQSVFAEAVFFTFQGLWFTVRARALASFTSGIAAAIGGNLLGAFIDRQKWSERSRARWSFFILNTLQGAWWIWGTIIVTQFHKTQPTYDWTTPGFGKGFAWFFFMVMSFQMNYMYLYTDEQQGSIQPELLSGCLGRALTLVSIALVIIGHIARSDAEIIRLAGLLRGTESAAQAVSYGVASINIMGQVGCVYLNFGLWGFSLPFVWFVIKNIGTKYSKAKREKSSTAKIEGIYFEDDGKTYE